MTEPRRRPAARWLLLLLLTGCEPSELVAPSYYRVEEAPPPLTLVFARGWSEPVGAARDLRRLALTLPDRAWLVVETDGPEALARARRVAHLLGRPVELLPSPAEAPLPPETARLVVQTTPGIVYDGCRGPGRPGVGDLWPGADGRRPMAIPPGCAVGSAIAAQVTDPSDLLRGKLLPPGASAPFAAAIERYYRRNDGNAGSTAEAAPAHDSATSITPAGSQGGGSGASGTAAPPASSANPLLGPLSR